METNKLLTIVIPVYNTEKYLRKCLDSLIVPSFLSSLDIIVVIDGSPDNSASIAREYEQKYPQTFRVIEKENGGHGSCCNVGLQQAEGKYIRFLDSDDWFENVAFESYLKKLSNTYADVILTPYTEEHVYDNRSILHTFSSIEFNQVYDADAFNYDSQSVLLFSLAGGTYTTSILRAQELQFTEKAHYDDTILYGAGLLGISKLLFMDEIVYKYFIGRPGQSMTPTIRKKNFQCMKNETLRLCKLYEYNMEKLSALKTEFLLRLITFQVTGCFRFILSTSFSSARNEFERWKKDIQVLPFFQELSKSPKCAAFFNCNFVLLWVAELIKTQLRSIYKPVQRKN